MNHFSYLSLVYLLVSVCIGQACAQTSDEQTSVTHPSRPIVEIAQKAPQSKTSQIENKAVVPPVKLTEKQWAAKLTPEQFKILRKKGTEAAFSGALLNEKRPGTYHCAGCGQALYSASTKYDSKSGWPSFFAAIDKAVKQVADNTHGMKRVELVCGRCEGHLGHIFDDGPQPTGMRHCINSAALTFHPKADTATKDP